jgi:Ca2+-binding EF-hand superfamily protein
MIALTVLALAFSAGPPAPPDDSHELIILHRTRPYRVRLHLRINGRPFSEPWARQVAQLFRHLDTNKDGKLSPKELYLAPSREQWLQMSSGDSTIDPDPAPPFAELARGKAYVSFGDLTAYYAGSAAGPLRMAYGANVYAGGAASDRLWEALRPDEAGPSRNLTLEDIKAAPKAIERLDANEDEMISLAELMGYPENGYYSLPPPTRAGALHGLGLYGVPVFSYRPDGPKAPLEKALRSAYPRRTVKLGPVDAVLSFDLGRDHSPRVVGKPHKDVIIIPTRGGLLLGIDDWRFHLRLEPPSAGTRSRREDARAVFKMLDRNKNGYLDKGEVQVPPFRFVSWERLADANQDGMVTEREFIAFAEMLDSLTGLRVAVEVTDYKRSLFQLIDADGDGKLGRRELMEAWKALPKRADGYEMNNMPRVFRIEVRAGRAELADQDRPKRYVPPERGPIWFRRMDRNRDGDVSLAEWLGTREEFARIDKDGDGMISAEEAEAYDKAMRSRKKR